MNRAIAVAMLTAVLSAAAQPADACQNCSLPAHTHLIDAGELAEPFYLGREFKYREAGCRYRDCAWNVIESVTYYPSGPFIPEYAGGPRVAIEFHHPGPHSLKHQRVVMLVHEAVLVRGVTP